MSIDVRIDSPRILGPDSEFTSRIAQDIPVLEEQVIKKWQRGRAGVAQGYTYLGQFLAHEVAPRPGVNLRTWKLDLDSLYPKFNQRCDLSNGPDYLIDQTNGKFEFDPPEDGKCKDLLRNKLKQAQIPEFRNDDQFIVAQLHILFQDFHNEVCDVLRDHEAFASAPAELIYYSAKIYVTACFQRIIVEDYLPQICLKHVYDALVSNGISIINFQDSLPNLPVEITHAVARFGHTQVRASYTLNTATITNKISLENLFRYTGAHSGTLYRGVPEKFDIDWTFFFDTGKRITKKAHAISANIVPSMLRNPEPNIANKNLRAGVRKKLSSGQSLATAVRDELRRQGLGDLGIKVGLKEIQDNVIPINVLKRRGYWRKTPIWLYILIEADTQNLRGTKLGPLGSLLVIETVKNGLTNSISGSYGHIQNYYKEFGLPEIDSMASLVAFTS